MLDTLKHDGGRACGRHLLFHNCCPPLSMVADELVIDICSITVGPHWCLHYAWGTDLMIHIISVGAFSSTGDDGLLDSFSDAFEERHFVLEWFRERWLLFGCVLWAFYVCFCFLWEHCRLCIQWLICHFSQARCFFAQETMGNVLLEHLFAGVF